MNWLKRMFGKKEQPKKEERKSYNYSPSRSHVTSNSSDRDDLLNPWNPISPFSVWINNDDNRSSSYDSGSSWSSSYDSSDSSDSSSDD